MERYVVIDKVCAWPNLTKMPNGDIVAVVFNQPCHGRWEGDVECWGTEDEGRTWSLRGVAAPHEPGTNRMNVAAGLAGNGDLVAIVSGWDHKTDPRVNPATEWDKDSRVQPSWVCRSSDGGRTWTQQDGFDAPEGETHVVPFGNTIELPDGGLGVSGYSSVLVDGIRAVRAWLYRSDDDGRSWQVMSKIAEGDCETDLLCPDGKRLLAASRSYRDSRLLIHVSDDGGMTWRRHDAVTSSREIPGHLAKLSDGRTLLTYGMRLRGFYGVGARLSADDGETWQNPAALLSFDDATDGGYPASVELKDGRILTAYYANRVAAHTRYHMGVIIWSVEEALNRNLRQSPEEWAQTC